MKANSAIKLTTLLLFTVISIPGISHAADPLIIVNDPATANALETFNRKTEEIALKCEQEMDMKDSNNRLKCICDHISEMMEANQAKIDAFLDLMKRRPELANKMVKIEGVFGNWYLDPNDPAFKKRNDLDFWKKRYRCK